MVDASLRTKHFGTVDLVVFIGLLVVSLLVGVYFAYMDRRKKTTDNYYFGERSMAAIPVGLSIAVTYVSALTVIGFPTEAYGYGTVTLWYGLSGIVGNVVACTYYVPLIRRLHLTSIFEYLEMRFNRKLRVLESIVMNLSAVFYFAIAIYLPALALSAVTPLSLNFNVVMITLVCTFYTALGGMKAVIWTDALQAFIMGGGMFAALGKTLYDVGGLDNVWAALERGERLTALNFVFDPTLPYTFWTIMIGQGFAWCTIGTSQPIAQRFMACRSISGARIAAGISLVFTTTFFFTSSFNGCLMYTYFEGCDPIKTGEIEKPDQLMPYLAVNVFRSIPGMAGLFVSAAFSATLSTVSSGLNACGALILEDFISPCFPNLSEIKRLAISKITVMVLGIVVMAISLCIQFIDATIFQVGFTIFGSLAGPLLGVYTLGLFLPWCNTIGAFVAQLFSTILIGSMGVVALVFGRPPEKYDFLPTTTDQCAVPTTVATDPGNSSSQFYNEAANFDATTGIIEQSNPQHVQGFLATSHLYYACLSFLVALPVGIATSFLTGANNPAKSDPRLFVPFVDNKLLPKSVVKFFRFGVPPLREELDSKEERKDFETQQLNCLSQDDSSVDKSV